MSRIIVSNGQQICRDCYAPAPKIDLTLRTNGEEKISVIDALGNVIPAGFDAPTVAPTTIDGATVGIDWLEGSSYTTGTVYWQYRYVYAAKTRYPLVENAQTGGGSQAPRSNPSPQLLTTEDNTATGTAKSRIISVTPSSRDDISHIWIYRTLVWDTKDKADTAGNAGLLYWIGEVGNDPNQVTIPFEDKGPVTSAAEEQIEEDNFVPQEAKYCVFDGTYFWAGGNDPRTLEVTLTAAGLVTNSTGNPWFNGRDAQIATFDGITSGGFDNHGSFYIKILSDTTAQLYSDLALTTIIGTTITGTTQIHIRGLATTLFRSKIRNPFAWGYTDQIGTINVPTPYAFSLGGGRITSLAIVPNLNLLKIDMEAPTQTVTLNLKNAGTPNFETSLRPIANAYTSSINAAQFSATTAKGQNQLWALDTKNFAIVASDGTSQIPVSDPVCQTMRNLAVDGTDRDLFHGCFMPRLDLNLMFIRTDGAEGLINRAIYNHWPTGQWGVLDTFDILASCPMVNPFTNETEVIVGTSEGWIGIFGYPDQYTNWVEPFQSRTGTLVAGTAGPNDYNVSGTGGFNHVGMVGNWLLIWVEDSTTGKAFNFGYVKLLAAINIGGGTWQLTLDSQAYDRNFNPSLGLSIPFPGTAITKFVLGPIEMQIGRFFSDLAFNAKSIEEIMFSLSYVISDDIFLMPSMKVGCNYDWDYDQLSNSESLGALTFEVERFLKAKSLATPASLRTVTYGLQSTLPIDQSSVYGIILSDRNTTAATLFSYQIDVALT